MNVKRLRPVELGPFDYEHSPVTTGLWVARGTHVVFRRSARGARRAWCAPQDYLDL